MGLFTLGVAAVFLCWAAGDTASLSAPEVKPTRVQIIEPTHVEVDPAQVTQIEQWVQTQIAGSKDGK